MAKSAVNSAENDASVNPKHYRLHPSGIQAIQITEWMPSCIAQAVQYVWRCGLKDNAPPISDLRKAVWFVNRELMRMGGESMLRPGLEGPEVLGIKTDVKTNVFRAPESLPIGSYVKILEVSTTDRNPSHKVGDRLLVCSVNSEEVDDTITEHNDACYFAYHKSGSGTYVTEVEQVE